MQRFKSSIKRHPRLIATGATIVIMASGLATVEALWGLLSSEPLFPLIYHWFEAIFPEWPRAFVILCWLTLCVSAFGLLVSIFHYVSKLPKFEEAPLFTSSSADKGLLDWRAEGDASARKMGASIAAATKEMVSWSSWTVSFTTKLKQAEGLASDRRLRDMNKAAVHIQSLADKLQRELNESRRHYEIFSDSYVKILKHPLTRT